MSFFRNVLWNLSGTIGVQLIGLITNIILARLLTPEIFGVVSLALVIIVFVHIIQEAGLSSVLVQKQKITKPLVATTFYVNITLSITLSLLVLFIAPKVALFYGYPELEKLLYYSIFGIIIGSFGVTFRGLLMRRRQFKKISIINLISELLGTILTFILFYFEEYFLAVGIRIIARPAFQSILLAYISNLNEIKGRPKIHLLKEILPFSSSVLGIKATNYIKNNVDYIVIGKILGSQSLGIYTIAFQWSTIAKFYISGSVAKVLFPEISKKQHDIFRVRQLFLNTVKHASFVIFPFCIGLMLIAPEFIYVIYGQQWSDAVPILQVLMIAGLLSSLGTVVGIVFQGLGRPNIELKITAISIFVFILLLIAGSYYGLIGVAFAVLIHAAIFDSILILQAIRLLNIPIKDLLKSLRSPFYSMVFVIIFYYLIKYMFFYEVYTFTSFSALLFIQIVLYIIASCLFNMPIVMSIYNIAKSIFLKAKDS
ncbi:lipopolysaccharide biosynthesis protein [Alteribacillus bidgolensis]|uniref:Polysaccharide transporter, PST family n=1 Tax=Alteribacillus bidgolensis TaxID=930129 RepID=A0A1G8PQK7_9BACI|nr:lipopolysaccharide biosynthesis protein [Alteribacillus bidgolensis]SDI94150.1 polysaccharide transporter, PST family [Alteribacillus bidgolensis]